MRANETSEGSLWRYDRMNRSGRVRDKSGMGCSQQRGNRKVLTKVHDSLRGRDSGADVLANDTFDYGRAESTTVNDLDAVQLTIFSLSSCLAYAIQARKRPRQCSQQVSDSRPQPVPASHTDQLASHRRQAPLFFPFDLTSLLESEGFVYMPADVPPRPWLIRSHAAIDCQGETCSMNSSRRPHIRLPVYDSHPLTRADTAY